MRYHEDDDDDEEDDDDDDEQCFHFNICRTECEAARPVVAAGVVDPPRCARAQLPGVSSHIYVKKPVQSTSSTLYSF